MSCQSRFDARYWMLGADFHFFECLILSQLFHSPLSPSSKGSLVPLSFLPLAVSSAYLRLIFLLEILIPACDSSSLAFTQCTLHKLNKHGDNIQPLSTPFPILNQPIVPCMVLTVASWPAYRFLREQVMWSGISISWRIFHSSLWSTQSKALV